MTAFLPFDTERLRLDRFTEFDIPAFVAYRSDAKTARYQGWDAPYPFADAQALVASQTALDGPLAGRWLQIAARRDGALIGDVAIGMSDDGTKANIGYTLIPEQRGHGLATEAVCGVVRRLFELTQVEQIRASLDARNVASARVVVRAGFAFESRAEQSVWSKGEWCDEDIYRLDRAR